MEENTDSSNSTLTHCANSAWKKKSDCDSARSCRKTKYVGYAYDTDGIDKIILAKARSMGIRARVLPFMPEFGYKGGLSLQFEDDMDHLKIYCDDRLLFFYKYGPTSSMYISMASQDPAHRRDMLRSLFDELKNNLSQPSAHASASSRKKRKS